MTDEKKAKPEDIAEVEEIIAEAVKKTGLKKKIIWEELRTSLFGVLDTVVKSVKAVPAIGYLAVLAEKPVEALAKSAENRKYARKDGWAIEIQKEIRSELNKRYIQRSAQELKNTSSQTVKSFIDDMCKNAIAAVFQEARNTSNKITMGVSLLAAVGSSVANPWVLPISGIATAATVLHQRKINREQIEKNVACNDANSKARAKVNDQQSQVLDNAEYYSSIKGFASSMDSSMNSVSDEEIEANRQKNKTILKNMDNNVQINTFWGGVTVVAPLALSYLQGGMSAVMGTGLGVVAASSSCFAMASNAITSYINSKLERKTAINSFANRLADFKEKDKDFERGNQKSHDRDNVIVLSKDLSYQHRDYSVSGAPLSGEDLFKTQSEIVIGPGVTILGGASGAGKTTLTTLLKQGAYATTGSVKLGHYEGEEFVGEDYKNLDTTVNNIAVAFQGAPEATYLSVGEYIMLENPNADPKKVREVKKLLGIGNNGETGEIDENACVSRSLSGGQQKRIELARALIKDSPIMILDEPTSGVDEVMSDRIVDYLKELGKEKTIVYITHDAREIEKIGAAQAIDIDKHHSEDGTNIIKTFDLTDENTRDEYIKFFENRRNVDMERNANLNDYRIAVDVVSLPKEDRLVYNKEYLEKVRGKLRGADKSATDELVSTAKTATVTPVSLREGMEV
ncbi:MAG: ABC transporter ATP-binding protein [Alphaproteobacteria bacterium]|nr:ABC transporter ATP-binding protein [Alphaproteobacteria bacterium]